MNYSIVKTYNGANRHVVCTFTGRGARRQALSRLDALWQRVSASPVMFPEAIRESPSAFAYTYLLPKGEKRIRFSVSKQA